MKILELFNTENMKSKTNIESSKIFPQQEEQIGTVEFRNLSIQNGTLNFDLRLKDLNPSDYTSVVVNSINLQEASILNNENFPDTLTPASQKILFSAMQGSVVLKPKKDLENISLDVKDISSDNYVILVSLTEDPIASSDVFLLVLNKNFPISVETKDFSYNEIFIDEKKGTTPLEIKEDKAYVSNMHLSYQQNGTLNGFYCIDIEKIVNNNSKFPNLFFNNSLNFFDTFLYKSEIFLYRYDKENFGYYFTSQLGPITPTPVDNIQATGIDGKRFYDFSIPVNDEVSEFQVVLNLYFNDVTINLAKQRLEDLKEARRKNDRSAVVGISLSIYGDEFEELFFINLNNILKISDIEFREIANKIINDLDEKINNASQKTVVNTNVNSQYTNPKPAIPVFYVSNLKQKFESKIHFGNKKKNNFFNFEDGNTFKTVAFSQFDVAAKILVTPSSKEFAVVKNKKIIKSFVLSSKKDITVANEGLQIKSSVSDADERSERNLADAQQQEFLKFDSFSDRGLKLYYLDSVGDSVSALLFKEVTGDFNSVFTPGTKILVRLDNYEEFYSSYFYVV